MAYSFLMFFSLEFNVATVSTVKGRHLTQIRARAVYPIDFGSKRGILQRQLTGWVITGDTYICLSKYLMQG
jgi:hypothetical protein